MTALEIPHMRAIYLWFILQQLSRSFGKPHILTRHDFLSQSWSEGYAQKERDFAQETKHAEEGRAYEPISALGKYFEALQLGQTFWQILKRGHWEDGLPKLVVSCESVANLHSCRKSLCICRHLHTDCLIIASTAIMRHFRAWGPHMSLELSVSAIWSRLGLPF